MPKPGDVLRSTVTMFAVVILYMQLLIITSGWPRVAEGARVLAVQTVYGKSHWNFMHGVLRAMVQDGGHRVTVYTPFADSADATVSSGKGEYVEVNTSAEYGIFEAPTIKMDDSTVVTMISRPAFLMPVLANTSRFICDLMDKLLADRGGPGDTFDLFVTEPLSSECVSHAARRLDVPLVYTVPAPLLPWIETSAFGHYTNPAHASHIMSTYAVPDTFYRRGHNLWLHAYTAYLHYRYIWSTTASEIKPYDHAPPVRPSLVFVNTHYVTEPSRPVPPNRIDVGGIHLKSPEPLPAGILKFIEDSPDGVIVFTLGSLVTMSSLPDNIKKAIIDALAELSQWVLMKYEGELADKPKNMMTSNWLPQRDILLHPKVKLFISHGGISGVYEAVDAGVPVLGFPLLYDQPRNIDNLVNVGMAISLDLMTVTKDQFLKAITDIIHNKTYAQNAKIVSQRFKDRPMTPSESVVYWTNYVIRHKGAPHLKSHALNLTWYQYFLLDVIAVVFLITLLVLFITFKVFRFIKKCIFELSPKSKSKPE